MFTANASQEMWSIRYTHMRMLHINTVHVQIETLWVKQLAEEQYKMICGSAWACKHTYIAESFVGLCRKSV